MRAVSQPAETQELLRDRCSRPFAGSAETRDRPQAVLPLIAWPFVGYRWP